MKIIYKYTIDLLKGDDLTIEMPNDYKIIKTALQNRNNKESYCIWAEVETENQLEKVHFRIHPTGQMFPRDSQDYSHLETVFPNNDLVWHIYIKNK